MSTDVDGDEPASTAAPAPVTGGASSPVTGGATVARRPARRSGDLLGRIGDIEVTAAALRTPAGRIPRAAASIEVTDERIVRTPMWAVFCAIVGTFAAPVISLLFLLVKETAPGAVRVRVAGGGVRHETVVTDPAEIELAGLLAAG
ncbi:hypothetical protein HC031_15550 [Planosporangium thailandense]|uniref:Uncharacterized protein n=1 Tax=Planosporangium thailandense TaxID=765197 RepID=A0ABX0XYI7_9ACTN|nr:hypothetical protein [Planosporangium thailandense]NJC71117.1 hypothetical protein [Planosporangium thailandense]